MLLRFDAINETIIPQFYGGQGVTHARMQVDELGKIMRGALEPHSSIGLHTHETSSEIIYILSGTGRVKYDDTEEPLQPGDCHYCPKGHTHSLINDTDGLLEFFAVVPNQ